MEGRVKVTNFDFKVKSISAGWEEFELIFDKIIIPFNASYIGAEPINSLLSSIINLESVANDYHTAYAGCKWECEPGFMKIRFEKTDDILNIDITHNDRYTDGVDEHQIFHLPYPIFREAIIKESLRVLKKYGMQGFNDNWMDDCEYFPLNELIAVLGSQSLLNSKTGEYHSDILNELEVLSLALQNN